MAFEMERFIKIRPYLYHLTAARNLAPIRASQSIISAAELMKRASRLDLLRQKRKTHEPIHVNEQEVILRDQAPLHKGNIAFASGYTFEDFIESLNSRIFFWPGKEDGPRPYGIRHFERYANEYPVIIRVQTQALIDANPHEAPFFCRYNSGSPRCVNGKKSPRGPDTFLRAMHFKGGPGVVVEVTFEKEILLPGDTKYGHNPKGPWQRLK